MTRPARLAPYRHNDGRPTDRWKLYGPHTDRFIIVRAHELRTVADALHDLADALLHGEHQKEGNPA